MKIKDLIWLVIATSLFTSCGIFKKRSRDISTQETAYKIENSGVKVSKDLSTQINKETTVSVSQDKTRQTNTDRGKVVTETEETTTRTRPPTTSNFSINNVDIKGNKTFSVADSFGNLLIGTFDSMNNILDISLQTPGVNETTNRKTRTTEDKDREELNEGLRTDSTRTDTENRKDSTRSDSTAIAGKEEFRDKKKEDRRKSSAQGIQIAIAVAGTAFLLYLLFLFINNRRKK